MSREKHQQADSILANTIHATQHKKKAYRKNTYLNSASAATWKISPFALGSTIVITFCAEDMLSLI